MNIKRERGGGKMSFLKISKGEEVMHYGLLEAVIPRIDTRNIIDKDSCMRDG